MSQRDCLQCGEAFQGYAGGAFCTKCSGIRYRLNGRAKAGSMIAKEIREGRMKKAKEFACTDCGKPATEYDHRDYSKPLDVQPVCHPCNAKRGPGKWVQFTPKRELLAA